MESIRQTTNANTTQTVATNSSNNNTYSSHANDKAAMHPTDNSNQQGGRLPPWQPGDDQAFHPGARDELPRSMLREQYASPDTMDAAAACRQQRQQQQQQQQQQQPDQTSSSSSSSIGLGISFVPAPLRVGQRPTQLHAPGLRPGFVPASGVSPVPSRPVAVTLSTAARSSLDPSSESAQASPAFSWGGRRLSRSNAIRRRPRGGSRPPSSLDPSSSSQRDRTS